VSLATPEKIQRLRESLYAKAKQEPECRFQFLYDKIHRDDVLAHAYAIAKHNRGAPGVDGQTFETIESQGTEPWLREIQRELKEKSYKPQPVRRVMIPKPGGTGERPLGIPTIRDRVVQTAAKLVLEPIFEADFDDAAHGYRPGRSAEDAIRQVHEALKKEHVEVIDADLSKYFDTIPHAELMKCLMRRISDGNVLTLIKMWLKAPVEERDKKGNRRMSGGKKTKCGTPQGGVISPLLANIYMHRYIKAFRKHDLEQRYGAVLVNYADDFVILCKRDAPQVLDVTRQWMTRIGLKINEEKTCVRNAYRESFNFLGYTFGKMYSPRTGGAYLGATPSKKAIARLRERIRSILRPGNMLPWEAITKELNATVRGWANYFGYGTVTGVRKAIDAYVGERVRAFMRRRHKIRRGGSMKPFAFQRVHAELGVYAISRAPKRTPLL
jgi:RNA-directed DNA polymerase